MLDSWIIEEIKKRENERHEEQLPVEIPLDEEAVVDDKPNIDGERGVVVIDLHSK